MDLACIVYALLRIATLRTSRCGANDGAIASQVNVIETLHYLAEITSRHLYSMQVHVQRLIFHPGDYSS